MEKTLLALATLAAVAVPAWATMPLLGEKPIRTDAACWAWAKEQAKDEEVAFMWGIRERIGQSKADQKARGRYLGGRVPFGFRLGDAGELVPHEAEQEAICEMVALRAQGKALRAIAEAVQANQGFAASRAKVTAPDWGDDIERAENHAKRTE
jgi:hypothetical protein